MSTEDDALAVRAVDALRRMRGGAQSILMLDENDRLWVVKLQNNPQCVRVLANEWIATRLAEAIGLSVPITDVVVVTEEVLANHPELQIELPRGESKPYLPGEHLGSAFVGGLFPSLVVDYLPEEQLSQVRNLPEFAGILALDKWTANCDGRQAVFHRTLRESKYSAVFIDQGFCFNAGTWNFLDSPLRGVYPRSRVYTGVTGWSSFEPWLSRIESMDFATMWRIAEAVPPIWYGGDILQLQRLMEQLFVRRHRVRDLIVAFRESDRDPFPQWTDRSNAGDVYLPD